MSKKLALVTGLIGMLALSGGPVQAAPVIGAANVSPTTHNVEQVQFRRLLGLHRHPYYHRRRHWHEARHWHRRHWRR
jgi:hypothetical protein